jgi:lysophospholipase L1-like esterase
MRTYAATYISMLIIAFTWCQQSMGQSASSAEGLQQIRARELAQELTHLSQQATGMQNSLLDWAILNRYRKENASLPPPNQSEHRVVFYGDSATDGWGRVPGTGEFFPGKPYVNRGISGETTAQCLVRFSQDVVHLKPEVVITLAGGNDIAGNTGPSTPEMIEDNSAAMAAIAKDNGIQFVIASILPASKYGWVPAIQPTGEIQEVNRWLQAFCASKGLIYLDYYSALVDAQGGMRSELSADGVHPNAQGYAIMAPLAEHAIEQALSRR